MAVAFDAASGPAVQGNAANSSWTHTATGGATALVWAAVAGPSAGSLTVTYGGTTMTLLGTDPSGGFAAYYLANVSAGSSTVFVSTPGLYLGTSCATYTGVSSVGAITAVDGTSTTISVGPVSPGSNGMVVANGGRCATGGGNYSITSPSGGDNRYSYTSISRASAAFINDASASTTFTASLTSAHWAAIAIPLNGAAAPSNHFFF